MSVRWPARRWVVAVGGAAMVSAAVGVYFFASGRLHEHRIKEFETRARDIARAVFSYFVDDCGGLPYTYGSVNMTRLTTPIAYIRELPRDPFAVPAAPLRLMVDYQKGNGSPVAIVSVGPDRVSDLELAAGLQTDITSSTDYKQYVLSRPEITSVSVANYGRWQDPKRLYDVRDALKFGNRDGTEYPVPQNIIQSLPHLAHDREEPESWLYEELIKKGFVHYDPTNGTTSRGDLLLLYNFSGLYDPVSKTRKRVPSTGQSAGAN